MAAPFPPAQPFQRRDMTKRLTIEERIKKHQAAAARLRAKLDTTERKQDTRRKILAGATILKRMAADAPLRARMAEILHQELTRDDDRALFQDLLPPDAGNHG